MHQIIKFCILQFSLLVPIFQVNDRLTFFNLLPAIMKKITSTFVLFLIALTCYAKQNIQISVGETILTSGSSTFDNGVVIIGYDNAPYFLITNIGNEDLTMGASGPITFSGTDASSFSVGEDLSEEVITPGGFQTFGILFSPETTGVKTATVSIASDDEDGAFTFTITGTAVATPADCIIPSADFETFQNSSSQLSAAFSTGLSGNTQFRSPSGWGPFYSLLNAILGEKPINVTETSVAHTGTGALELFNDGVGSADISTVFACGDTYSSLKGFYTFTGEGENDLVTITVSTGGGDDDYRTETNTVEFVIDEDETSYTEFNIPLLYDGSSQSEIFIHIFLSTNGDNSFFRLDDLSFGPSVPAGAPYQPEKPTFSNISTTGVTVNWIAPYANSAAINGYVLEEKEGEGGDFIEVYSGTNLSHTASGLTEGQTYFYRVKASNAEGDSDFSDVAEVIPKNTITMANSTTESCEAIFTDSGGASANYSNEENYLLTIEPSTPGGRVSISFTSFELESGWDYLHIYDGATTSATEIATLTGSSLPSDYTASTEGGELTFKFTSDGFTNKAGWEATISCETFAPAAPSKPSVVTFGPVTSNSAVINWVAPASNGSTITGYTLQEKTSTGDFSTVYTGTNLTYTSTGLAEGETYSYRVKASNGIGDSDYSDEASVVPQSVLLMSSGTISTCSATFKDPGGDANYSNDEDVTLTVQPSTPGGKVSISFTSFHLENTYDFLYIYDGPDDSTSPLATLTGTSLPSDYTSTAAAGELTFKFTSDDSFVYSGWEATLSCVLPEPEEPSAPAKVTFTGTTTTSVVVNWAAPASNGSAITGYTLEQKAGVAGTFSEVYAGTDLSYSATGLSTGETYYFRVKATNGIGDSEFSEVAEVFIPNVPATPGAVTFGDITESSVVINWMAPDNGGSAITSYVLERKLGTENFETVYSGSNLTFTSQGLSGENTYIFRVKATNAVGHSDYSEEASVCIPFKWFKDADGDGLGDGSESVLECTQPTGYVATKGDCNDNDSNIKQGSTWYQDSDGDGFGNASVSQVACQEPPGFTVSDDDCDDTDANVYPNAPAIPDGKDNNCDGTIDKVDQTISFDVVSEVVFENNLTISLSATATSLETVAFASSRADGVISGNSLAITSPGEYTVTASQGGNSGYNPAAEVSQTFCVLPPSVGISGSFENDSPLIIAETNFLGGTYRWFLNGKFLKDDDASLEIDTEGVYQLQVIADGCEGELSNELTVVFEPDVETGVNPRQLETFRVNPNPATSSVALSLESKSNAPVTATIFSIGGTVIHRQVYNKASQKWEAIVDLSEALPGMYFIRISHGENTTIKKLIKN
jgi:hypothetical protein